MDYQDVINYQLKSIMLLKDEELWHAIQEDNYLPIFIALRKGPMTVKELEESYNDIINEKINKMSLDQKEKSALKAKMQRKDKTLYKYLDFLQQKGVVVQVGKRVKMGQTATESLYGRAAKAFIYTAPKGDFLTPEDKNKSLKAVEKILTLDRDVSISMDCFIETYNKILLSIDQEKERIFQKYEDEITKIASNLSFDDLKKVIAVLEMIALINDSKLLQADLDKCFKK